MNNKEDNSKKALFGIQWHITNSCNLRCLHCYQEDYTDSSDLDLDGLKIVANEIIKTLGSWNKIGDIAITGGEPILKKEFFHLLSLLQSADEISSIDILTNGTLLNERVVEKIRNIEKIRCVQISLDGASSKTHDAIRGSGTFDKAMNGIHLLNKYSIPINIMFTLQQINMGEIPALIDLSIAEDINNLTIERFVPIGSGATIENRALDKNEIETTFNYISTHAEEVANRLGRNLISMSRPLWVLCDGKNALCSASPNNGNTMGGICSIGLDGLCILPDATVLACRRLPIPIGNLKTDSLLKIWHQSDLLWEIADKRNLKGKCNACESITQCSGCRAMAYACTGDYLAEDPQCWK